MLSPALLSRRRLLFLGACLLSGLGTESRADESPVVAAAADLQFALKDVAMLFARDTGKAVRVTFGSSGNFYRQIAEGAPFEVFLSADENYVLALHRKGRTDSEGVLYAVGRIAVMAPHGSPLKADGSLRDLAAALDDGRLKRFVIANPEHAPYGKRAEEALRHAGLWERIHPRLVVGENVSQAAQFAASGAAQGGIIAYSLALSPSIARLGSFDLIAEDWHTPLRQRMALAKAAGATARAFYGFMQSDPARAVLRRYGFGLAGTAG